MLEEHTQRARSPRRTLPEDMGFEADWDTVTPPGPPVVSPHSHGLLFRSSSSQVCLALTQWFSDMSRHQTHLEGSLK